MESSKYEAFTQIQSCAPQQISNYRFFESRSVKLDANSPLILVEDNSPDAIHFAHAVERTHSCLGRRPAVAVSHFQLRHLAFLPPSLKIQQSLAPIVESNILRIHFADRLGQSSLPNDHG